MLFVIGLSLLICSAAASLFFDLTLIVQFFPGIFTRYEMFLFDSTHFDLGKDFPQSFLDVSSHYSLANMFSHSTIFIFLLFILSKKSNLQMLSLFSLYFLLTLGSKMFFASWIFGIQSYFFSPAITLLCGSIGFTLLFMQLIVKKVSKSGA